MIPVLDGRNETTQKPHEDVLTLLWRPQTGKTAASAAAGRASWPWPSSVPVRSRHRHMISPSSFWEMTHGLQHKCQSEELQWIHLKFLLFFFNFVCECIVCVPCVCLVPRALKKTLASLGLECQTLMRGHVVTLWPSPDTGINATMSSHSSQLCFAMAGLYLAPDTELKQVIDKSCWVF